MKVTIIDIAKKAGVSRTTVSNVLNGNTFRCSQQTKEKVLKIAKELGYQPNLAAKTLVTNKSDLIGVLFPSYVDDKTITNSYFYSNIVKGIQIRIMKELNKDFIMKFLNKRFNSDDVISWIMKRNLEGLIGIGELDRDLLLKLDSINLPVVLVDNYSDNLSNFHYINTDDEYGGYIATKHLLNDEYKKVAYCTSAINCTGVNYKRYLGYKKAIYDFNKEEYIIEENDLSFDVGKYMVKRIINKKIDGVFCSSDTIALGIMRGLYEKGIKIPEDVGIVGFDNMSFSRQSILTLTTIDQDILNKGILAVDLLIKNIEKCDNNNKKNKYIKIPVSLVKGESTRNR